MSDATSAPARAATVTEAMIDAALDAMCGDEWRRGVKYTGEYRARMRTALEAGLLAAAPGRDEGATRECPECSGACLIDGRDLCPRCGATGLVPAEPPRDGAARDARQAEADEYELARMIVDWDAPGERHPMLRARELATLKRILDRLERAEAARRKVEAFADRVNDEHAAWMLAACEVAQAFGIEIADDLTTMRDPSMWRAQMLDRKGQRDEARAALATRDARRVETGRMSRTSRKKRSHHRRGGVRSTMLRHERFSGSTMPSQMPPSARPARATRGTPRHE